VTDGFEFLGFHVAMRWDKRYGYGPRVEIPKAKAADLRRKVKLLTGRNTVPCKLGEKLQEINRILRGWANYYRYCARAGRVFTSLDWYVRDRLWRWMRKKHPKAAAREILRAHQHSNRRRTRRLWRDGTIEQYLLAWTLGWERLTSPCLLECRMRNERRTSGSERGGKKLTAAKRHSARRLLYMIATAIYRSTSSAADICWQPSCAAPTSMLRPVPSRRLRAW
jgi:Group II intron, maturase-specific domain